MMQRPKALLDRLQRSKLKPSIASAKEGANRPSQISNSEAFQKERSVFLKRCERSSCHKAMLKFPLIILIYFLTPSITFCISIASAPNSLPESVRIIATILIKACLLSLVFIDAPSFSKIENAFIALLEP